MVAVKRSAEQEPLIELLALVAIRGAHADFLTLKRLLATNNPLFEPAVDVFVTKYGLLGLLHRLTSLCAAG